jgi:hypothetical protein
MKKKMKYCLLPLLFIILIGCSAKVTEEDLIEGYWVATAGYQDGEPEGEPYCLDVVTDGLEFRSDNTVFVEVYDSDFSYWLEDNGDGIEIHFRGEEFGLYLSYYIDKISENEVGLTGKGDTQSEESCYLERQY